ncbi:MAG TPA: replication-relaxation family protein [Pirellulales bacterium]|nr:replication-relaxation family protein [Pirellulales bacterium]
MHGRGETDVLADTWAETVGKGWAKNETRYGDPFSLHADRNRSRGDSDIAIFRDLARYRFLDRRQIQRLHFPDDATGRACRRRLLELVNAGYIDRLSLLYAHPVAGSPAAVFQLAKRGYELLCLFLVIPGSLYFLPLFDMDAKKKNAPPKALEEKRAPVKAFTADDVSAAIFRRDYNERTFYSVTFTRWYRDKGGQNRYVNSFGLEDLGKIVTVAQQSDEYIRALPASTSQQ